MNLHHLSLQGHPLHFRFDAGAGETEPADVCITRLDSGVYIRLLPAVGREQQRGIGLQGVTGA